MIELKKKLHNLCMDYVQKRMDAAQQAIAEAQKASNDDTKSSAGDKYETSREMMQQETNRNLGQLNEANKLKIALNHINVTAATDQAETGSLVKTNNGNFYLAISAGTFMIKNENYMAVSPASPIGLMLRGLKAGNEFKLNDKIYLVKAIF